MAGHVDDDIEPVTNENIQYGGAQIEIEIRFRPSGVLYLVCITQLFANETTYIRCAANYQNSTHCHGSASTSC
jgi:hypothetical protein